MQGHYTYVNNYFSEKFSFITDNFIGKSVSISVYEEDMVRCEQAGMACYLAPDKPTYVILRKPKPTGGFYWSHWQFSAMLNTTGQVEGIFCIGYDITNEKTNYEDVYALDSSHLVECITDGYTELDADYKVKAVNESFLTVVGIRRQEILGQSLWKYLKKEDHGDIFEFFEKCFGKKIITQQVAAKLSWLLLTLPVIQTKLSPKREDSLCKKKLISFLGLCVAMKDRL
jgi:PAS domain-containing protein